MASTYYAVSPRFRVNRLAVDDIVYKAVVAGAVVSQFDVVYENGSQVRRARADSSTTMDGVGIASQVVGAGGVLDVIIRGRVTNASWGWTSGSPLFVSATSGGLMTHTPPSASGNISQRIGIALTTTVIDLNPQTGFEISE